MLTVNDLNRDFKAIIEGVTDVNRPIPTMMKAVKAASILPLIVIMLSTLSFGIVCAHSNHLDFSVSLLTGYIFSGDAIPVYMSIVVGFAQAIILLPYMSLYYSIPKKVRDSTNLISSFKRAVFKWVMFYLAAIALTCILSFKNEIYLFSTPVVMFIAVFVSSITINLQVTKYGVGALLEKLKKISN